MFSEPKTFLMSSLSFWSRCSMCTQAQLGPRFHWGLSTQWGSRQRCGPGSLAQDWTMRDAENWPVGPAMQLPPETAAARALPFDWISRDFAAADSSAFAVRGAGFCLQ